MKLRILAGLVVVLALTGLLIYGQSRRGPDKISGFVEAEEIRLGSRLGGRVAEVLVEEGQTIAAGALLVRLETYDWDERLKESQAQLALRRSELERLTNGSRPEEIGQAAARVERLRQKLQALVEGPRPEELEASRARLRLAQTQWERARLSYERNAALFATEKGAVTRETMDRATEEAKVAEAAREVREQELKLLEKGSRDEDVAAARAEMTEAEQALLLTRNGPRAEEIAQAKAAVEAAAAALAALQTQRGELEIRSPTPGVVDAIRLQPGDLVAPNAPALAVIDTRKLWIRAYVPENRLDIRVGQPADVTVDSYPGERFAGEVTFISRQAEFTPSNVQTAEERAKQVFRIKVALRTGHDRLQPGMPADVWWTGAAP